MTEVSVTLHGLSFNKLENLAVLLAGPDGKSIVLVASYDRVPPGTRPYSLSDATWTFKDPTASLGCFEAEGAFPTSQGVKNAANCLLAPFPAPAPAPPYSEMLRDVSDEAAGGGVWSLYVYGYSGGEGVIAGGWSVRIERHPIATLPVPPVNRVLPSISGRRRSDTRCGVNPGRGSGYQCHRPSAISGFGMA
jgi:hypothetical protein